MNDPTISIIVPVYNSETYIQSCILSIKEQSYSNFECLLIDDGSSDRSVNKISRSISDDSRFHLVKQDNGGVSSARNRGIEQMNGQFITFVDSDDFIHNRMLEILLSDILLTPSIGFSMCGIQCVNFNIEMSSLIQSCLNPIGAAREFEDPTTSMISNKSIKSGSVCNKLFRSDIVQNLRFDEDISFGEDQLFLYDVLTQIRSFSVRSEALLFYRQNEKSAVVTATSRERCKFARKLAQMAQSNAPALRREASRVIFSEVISRPARYCVHRDIQFWENIRSEILAWTGDELFEPALLSRRRAIIFWLIRRRQYNLACIFLGKKRSS